MMFAALVCLAVHVFQVRGAFDISFDSDDDLTSFVSRPDIRAPLLDVEIYDETAVLPGKWFIAPYADIQQQSHPRNYYQACQTGPAIYDAYGELVWSGACDVLNQNTVDFRVVVLNGSDHLSMILNTYGGDSKGHGVILNSSFDVVHEIKSKVAVPLFNMHELNLVPTNTGLTALHLATRIVSMDVRDLDLEAYDEGFVADTGIREVDVLTGETLFEWWPSDHISPLESHFEHKLRFTTYAGAWNWIHANSVDKNDDGDYLLSARFTSTIYRISGKDGSIVWRLGGDQSTFQLSNFNFSSQHDARWISSNEDEEIISFLDNGAENIFNKTTSQTSSGLVVSLDKRSTPPVARVINRWWRPDGKLSSLRGNFQTFLHSTNVVACWSDNSYITEHDESDRLLAEVRFQSQRMVTYRAYKFNFTGTPTEPPDLAAFTFGVSDETAITVSYVSWNGATEVAQWNFFRGDGEIPVLLGSAPRTGFETVFQARGYHLSVFAEAVDKEGRILGRSDVRNVTSSMTRSRPHTTEHNHVNLPRRVVLRQEPVLSSTESIASTVHGKRKSEL